MSLYRRGKTWYYKFKFRGQVICGSSSSASKTVARDALHARRHRLEEAINRIPRRERMPLFPVAAQEWLKTKASRAPHTHRRYRNCVGNLKAEFGDRLICDISETDVVAYQSKRLAQGRAPRTVNYEVGTLRGILKHFRLWSTIAEGVKGLRERHDVGQAIPPEDEAKLLNAARQSRSPALLPLMILSLDTGLRASEVKSLRRSDIHLCWSDGLIVSGELVVPTSKTEAGTGRSVPLSRRACAVMTLWLSRFPDAGPDSYVFPYHRVGNFAGNMRQPTMWNVNPKHPMGSWRSAWTVASKQAGLLRPMPETPKRCKPRPWRARTKYRWHDLRHTFVSRLAENPNVSEQTIRALAGHVSKRMLERYSHIRKAAKQAAIESLEQSYPKVEILPESGYSV